MKHHLAIAAAALLALPAASPAQAGEASVEQRLQRVEDILAIKRIILEYAVTLDAQDFDAYVALFAKDGVWQIGDTVKKGPAEIKAMLVDLYGTPTPNYMSGQRFRIVSNMQVDVDGDRATARSRHLSIMRGENGSPSPTLAGLYEDEYIREDGEWKILHRTDYPLMPTPEEWLVQLQQIQAAQAAEAAE